MRVQMRRALWERVVTGRAFWERAETGSAQTGRSFRERAHTGRVKREGRFGNGFKREGVKREWVLSGYTRSDHPQLSLQKCPLLSVASTTVQCHTLHAPYTQLLRADWVRNHRKWPPCNRPHCIFRPPSISISTPSIPKLLLISCIPLVPLQPSILPRTLSHSLESIAHLFSGKIGSKMACAL